MWGWGCSKRVLELEHFAVRAIITCTKDLTSAQTNDLTSAQKSLLALQCTSDPTHVCYRG